MTLRFTHFVTFHSSEYSVQHHRIQHYAAMQSGSLYWLYSHRSCHQRLKKKLRHTEIGELHSLT